MMIFRARELVCGLGRATERLQTYRRAIASGGVYPPISTQDNRARRLCHDDSGIAAVEFALVLPILLLLLGGIMQFGSLFFIQNNMTDVARDSARRLAVGELTSADTPQYVQDSLVDWGVTFSVAVTEPDPNDPDDKDITVAISAPMSQASLINLLNFADSQVLSVQVIARQE